MITLTKALIGFGAVGTTGLAAWGAYHISLPKTIQDKLAREGLEILNLDVSKSEHEAEWKAKIAEYPTDATDENNLKINGLEVINSGSGEDEANSKKNIEAFKNKCIELLRTSLKDSEATNKEKQTRKWCVKK